MVKWKTILGLILLLLAVINKWMWMWGILFMFWVVTDIKSRKSYFIEEIDRDYHPFLYWVIVIIWFTLGLSYLVPYFYVLFG